MLAISLAALLIASADAHESELSGVTASASESASESVTSRFITPTASVGGGVGFSHGVVGASGEVGFRLPSGAGLSAELGAGLVPIATGRVWLFGGERARFGADLSWGTTWKDLPSPQSSSCMGPGMGGAPSRTEILGAGLTVDHDVGASGAWSMRYGLGAGMVVSGCAGGLVPNPTVALRYTF